MTSTRKATTGEHIVAAFLSIDEHDRSYRGLSEAIDTALAQREAAVRAEERERAAGIAQDRGTVFYRERQKQHSPYDPKDLVFGQDVCDKIAAAIRRDPAAEKEGR